MDVWPASLGFDPTIELKDRLFEVGDRGFHLGDATVHVANARLVQALEPRSASPITVLACVMLSQGCIDQLRFVLESFHLRTPHALGRLSSDRAEKIRPPDKARRHVARGPQCILNRDRMPTRLQKDGRRERQRVRGFGRRDVLDSNGRRSPRAAQRGAFFECVGPTGLEMMIFGVSTQKNVLDTQLDSKRAANLAASQPKK